MEDQEVIFEKEEGNFLNVIQNLFIKYKILIFVGLIIAVLVIGTMFIENLYSKGPFYSLIIFVFFASLFLILVGLVRFYLSPGRMQQKFNQFHASYFLSSFFRIYFPVVIISLILQFGLTFALLPPQFGGLGLLDFESISPSLMLAAIGSSFITALGVIVLADYGMKKNNLKYSNKVGKISFSRSLAYILPLSGLYFGAVFFSRFILEQIIGPFGLTPEQANPVEIDYGVIRGAKFWDLLTETEKNLVLLTFLMSYIALEILLRGLMAAQARGFKLGAAGVIFMPAVLQATAFSIGVSIFSQPLYYLLDLFDSLLLGIVLGVIMWRTGNFISVIFTGLFIRFMDNRIEFQSVVLKLLPRNFGEYNPLDSVVSVADNLGLFFTYLQISIVIISPFIFIVGYQEVFKITKAIYSGLKDQWFGLFIFGFAFFLIDLVFFFVLERLGGVLGFIVAILVIGFVIRYLFKVLPEPSEIPSLHNPADLFEGELPLNLSKDLKYLESADNKKYNPKVVGILGAFFFVYFLFLSATYRQTEGLTTMEVVTFVAFLVILPTIIIGSATFLLYRAHQHGYFFSQSWRSNIFIIGIILFIVNILIWTDRSSTVNFSWRVIPLALFFILFLKNNPLESPTRDLALGLARDGRYATMRWISRHPDIFESEYENLVDLPSDNIKVGAHLIGAKLRIIDPDTLVADLREGDMEDRADIIGKILGLGILEFSEAEGLLLDQITTNDIDIRVAAYWSLGKLASHRALRRMAKILEENPAKELIPIAESAILSIDPNYPLAGIRDSIKIN